MVVANVNGERQAIRSSSPVPESVAEKRETKMNWLILTYRMTRPPVEHVAHTRCVVAMRARVPALSVLLRGGALHGRARACAG